MAIDPNRIKAVFQAAIACAEPVERRAFLDREVGDDPEFRDRLDALLAAFDRPHEILDRLEGDEPQVTVDIDPNATGPVPSPVAEPTHGADPVIDHRRPGDSSVIDTVIAGRYKIRQGIGEGGMGSVYLAEQTRPVKRMVALKLIKAGMDSRNVLARFESERQALALMDHPNIARVLDAGSTEQGRPFFVMELVKGIPITDYCDRHHLGIPERLAIFRQVCSAVQHAHQKGIIHRDLKPTNILVEAHDDKPVPKVIDFGLAKATSGMKLTDNSLFTAFGSVTGTPLYMAPEQATFNALDVDTRADIYALGALLYELLTGSTPIPRGTLQRAALDEMLRVIREVEPPTPSSRISTSDGLPSLAANRHIEPTRLSRFVKGDLDWIVMKALAKERNRRYDSAIGLANDVERFLNDEPVMAGPPTARYRTSKFIRRHRRQVVAACLIFLALVGGTVGTTLGLFEARKQRDLARDETAEKERARAAEADQRLKAEAARRDEARARQTAERRSAQLGTVNVILGSIFRDLDLDQAEQEGKPVVIAIGERLDQASAALEGESIGDPATVARLQMTLGQAQLSLGNNPKAVNLLERARAALVRLGPDDTTTLSCSAALGWAYDMDGHLDRATAMLEPVVAAMKAKLGSDHADTLVSAHNLASVYMDSGRLDRAIPLFEQTLAAREAKMGPDHRDTIKSIDELGVAYRYAGQYDRSTLTLERAVEAAKAKLGPNHVLTLMCMSNLGNSYNRAGRLDRAIPLLERVLEARRAKLGANNDYTLVSMDNLAHAYRGLGRLDRAISLLEQSLKVAKARKRPDDYEFLIPMALLGALYTDAGRFDRAMVLLEQALEGMKTSLGPDHHRTIECMDNLGRAYRVAGQLDRATSLHEQALARARAKLGPDRPETLALMADLARDYALAGRHGLAIPLFEQAWAGRRAKLGPDHPDTLRSLSDLAGAHADAGDVEKAAALDRECLEAHARLHRPDSIEEARAQASAGSRLLRRERWAEAEPMLRAALATHETIQPDAWATDDVRSLLGGALLGQGKHDEARPLLVAGFEGMIRRLATIPAPDRGEPVAAADRLIRLAEATGKPDEAKAWRDEKAKLATQATPPKTAEEKR
jgi:serine/threonine protein kinase/tetratricopeptide (TPR) repeat protein